MELIYIILSYQNSIRPNHSERIVKTTKIKVPGSTRGCQLNSCNTGRSLCPPLRLSLRLCSLCPSAPSLSWSLLSSAWTRRRSISWRGGGGDTPQRGRRGVDWTGSPWRGRLSGQRTWKRSCGSISSSATGVRVFGLLPLSYAKLYLGFPPELRLAWRESASAGLSSFDSWTCSCIWMCAALGSWSRWGTWRTAQYIVLSDSLISWLHSRLCSRPVCRGCSLHRPKSSYIVFKIEIISNMIMIIKSCDFYLYFLRISIDLPILLFFLFLPFFFRISNSHLFLQIS